MRLFKAIIFFLFILLVANQSLWGNQEPIRPSGLMGPRALAMGGSNVAVPGYSSATIINPASLVFINWPELSAGFGQQDLGDQQVWYVNAAMPLFSKLVGQINVLSVVNPYDIENKQSNYNLSLAFPVSPNGQLLAGVTGKFVNYDLDLPTGVPSGGGVDLGLIYTIWENEDQQALRLGIAMIDAQTVVKLNSQSFELPTVFRYGLSWQMPEQWLTTFELDNQQSKLESLESFSVIRMGLEKTISIPETEGLVARLGFFHNLKKNVALTVGVGFGFENWHIDYALQLPTNVYNAYHQIGLSWGLGREQPSAISAISQSSRKKQEQEEEVDQEDYSSIFSTLDSAAEADDEFDMVIPEE